MLSNGPCAAAHFRERLHASQRCQQAGGVHRRLHRLPPGLLLPALLAAIRHGAASSGRHRAAFGSGARGPAADSGNSSGGSSSAGRAERPDLRQQLPAQQCAEPHAVLPQHPAAPSGGRRRAGRQRRGRWSGGRRAVAASAAAGAGAVPDGCARRAFPVHICHECHLFGTGAGVCGSVWRRETAGAMRQPMAPRAASATPTMRLWLAPEPSSCLRLLLGACCRGAAC